ncbi:cell division protein FtsQ/DivIB [Micrococcus lacusdianchii]|uniref:cell division protein FtsQ/DivIB n=1 Tax=Micrococcus lacusdianchii TaxID=2915940 RepID=UPI002005D37C
MSRRRGATAPRRATAPTGSTVVAFPGLSARQRRVRRLTAVLAALLVAAAAVWAVFLSPLLAVDRIEVTGTSLVDRDVVRSRLEPLMGTPLPRVRSDDARGLLEGTPGIREVTSVALPPTGVEVRVAELAPTARAEDVEDGVLLADGSVLTGVAEETLVRAREGEDVLPRASAGLLAAGPDVRAAAAAVLAGLPASVAARVTGVDAQTPEQVSLTLADGPVLVWGDASRPGAKAAVVEAFLDGTDGAVRGVSELDVSVPERPLTR